MQMKNDMENILDFVTLNILFFIFNPMILIITLCLSLFSWFTILANYFIKKCYDI